VVASIYLLVAFIAQQFYRKPLWDWSVQTAEPWL
jgi:hypothetical protein